MCEKAKATQRVAFPNVHDRPEQQTLVALLLRNVVIFFLYAVWIVISAVNLFYWVYSAVAFLKNILSLGSIPVPVDVQIYMAAFTTYTCYHFILYRKTPQVKWNAMVKLFTHLLHKYPYYQHQACIFEEHEEECLNDPKAPMVNADERAIFAYHPHGAFTCAYTVGGMLSHRFMNSDTVFLAAHNMFWFPGVNDVLRWLGVAPVTKPVFTKYLEADRNVALYPGGFEEATYFWRGKHRLFLKNRAGFIKLALQYGYKVRPVYTFGEEETYHTMHHFPEWRVLLNKLKIRAVLFWGCFHVFFMPRQSVNMTTVVGKAIQMPKIENPTTEDVRKYHALYMDALVGLFERNKHKYALDPSQELEIF